MTAKKSAQSTRQRVKILTDGLKASEDECQALRDQVEELDKAYKELIEFTKDSARPAPGYESLLRILKDAHDQAACGKGAERHGNDLPFGAQPMQTIGFLLHSSEGMMYQAMKKIQEANSRLKFAEKIQDKDSTLLAKRFARWELLGAINYLAGAILFQETH